MLLSKESFQQKILEIIRSNGSALFSDLELSIGDATRGDLDFILPGRPNSVLWDHVSQEFANALFELLKTKQIQANLVSVLEYLDEGCLMTLPPATKLQKADYKKPTWVPVRLTFRKQKGNGYVN